MQRGKEEKKKKDFIEKQADFKYLMRKSLPKGLLVLKANKKKIKGPTSLMLKLHL